MDNNTHFLSRFFTQTSFFAQTCWQRLLLVAIMLAVLWLTVIWAVALP